MDTKSPTAAEGLGGLIDIRTEPQGIAPRSEPIAPRTQVVHRIDDAPGPSGKTQAIERTLVRHSEEIDQLITALAIAQGGFEEVERTLTAEVESRRTGGKYAYEYETLADVIKATRKPLSENGLAVLQFPFPGRESLTIRTMLAHKSGQWIYNDLTCALPGGLDPQSVGSGITYLQRYARKAILGIAAGYDDDGKAASQALGPQAPAAPAGYSDWLLDLEAVADNGLPALTKAWNASKPEHTQHLIATDKARWERIKAKAQAVSKGGRA